MVGRSEIWSDQEEEEADRLPIESVEVDRSFGHASSETESRDCGCPAVWDRDPMSDASREDGLPFPDRFEDGVPIGNSAIGSYEVD